MVSTDLALSSRLAVCAMSSTVPTSGEQLSSTTDLQVIGHLCVMVSAVSVAVIVCSAL